MAKTWQYQALVDPLSVDSETVKVDEWFVNTSTPVRRQASRRHLFPAMSGLEISVDSILADDIKTVVAMRVEQPYRRHKRLTHTYPSLAQNPQRIPTDNPEVFTQVDAPYRKQASRRHLYPSHFQPIDVTFEESPSVDRFMPHQPDQVWRPKPRRAAWPSWMAPAFTPAPPATVAEIMAAVRQTPIPYRRQASRRHNYPIGAFKEPSVLFFPCPPPTNWDGVAVERTNWDGMTIPRTDWTQTPEFNASDIYLFDDTGVLFDDLVVLFDGADPALINGSFFDPPNTDWTPDSPARTPWTKTDPPPPTDWEKCGGSDG